MLPTTQTRKNSRKFSAPGQTDPGTAELQLGIVMADPGTAGPGTAELQLGIVMAYSGTAELQLGILHANMPPTAYDPDPPPGSW